MAKKDNIKQLTPTELAKQAKALEGQQDFVIKVGGQDYKLTHDVKFRQTKRSKLLADMLMFFQQASKDVSILDMATPYTATLILKHFTSIEVPDDIVEAMATMQTLIDLDIINQVLPQLPEDELVSVYELITNTVNNLANNLIDAEEEAVKFAENHGTEEMKALIPESKKSKE